jgi:hypothetical protein
MMDLHLPGGEGADLIHLAGNAVKSKDLTNTVLTVPVPQKAGSIPRDLIFKPVVR